MGTDTPLAVLSDRPQLLYNYFKQLFAQVTNPPVDAHPRRDHHVDGHDHRPRGQPARADAAVGPADQAARRRSCATTSWRSCASSTARRPARLQVGHAADRCSTSSEGGAGLRAALERAVPRRPARRSPTGTTSSSCPTAASTASTRRSRRCWPWPAVHHHLIREGTRTQVGLVLESGEPREVHHFALLHRLRRRRDQPVPRVRDARRHDPPGACCTERRRTSKAVKNYVKAVNKGVVKVMSKMGISTIQSYRGAQIFEAIGLNQEFDRQVLHLDAVAHRRHRPRRDRRRGRARATSAPSPTGRCQRPDARRRRPVPVAPRRRVPPVQPRDGPQAAARLPHRQLRDLQGVQRSWSTTRRSGSARCAACSSSSRPRRRCRIEEVEPVEAIVKRFKTGAMSYGSISKEAHETLAIAMNRIGGKSNTGEGGEDPARYMPDANGDSQQQRHQAGRLGPLRRHQRVPGQRRGAADQDGPGRQARRGRPAARAQGLPVDRQGPPLDAGRRPDLAAAAPRHLLDRGPGRADPRPEERQPRTRASASSWWPRSASARSPPASPRRTPTWC